MTDKSRPKTQISERIVSAMEEKELSIRDLAEKLDTTYEHARSMVRGLVVPSRYMTKALADVLGEDEKELWQLAVSDRIRLKYGKVPMEIAGKNPELEPIEHAWKQLTEEHKQDIIAMVQTYAKRDKGGKK